MRNAHEKPDLCWRLGRAQIRYIFNFFSLRHKSYCYVFSKKALSCSLNICCEVTADVLWKRLLFQVLFENMEIPFRIVKALLPAIPIEIKSLGGYLTKLQFWDPI